MQAENSLFLIFCTGMVLNTKPENFFVEVVLNDDQLLIFFLAYKYI